MARIFTVTLAIIIALLGLIFIWPAKVDPAYWEEPVAPTLTGILEPRGRLGLAEEIGRGIISNSEDIAIDPDGNIYASQTNGSISKLTSDNGVWSAETMAQVSEYPALGLQWDNQGNLIVAASDGLYAVNIASGEVETLSTSVNGRAFGFADDLDIGPDGIIYFTDASWKWPNAVGEPSYQYDMAENRPYGSLLSFDPRSGETRSLVEDLYFANGVAMAADGRSVFFLETYRYRLSRYWIEGPQAGTMEIIDDNLPGIPDGLMGDGQGNLYIAMDTQRVPILRFLHQNPFLTRLITKLPESIWLRAGTPQGFILKMTEGGEYLDSYHDPDGRFGFIANVIPDQNGDLWIGSLDEDVIGRFSPPQ